MSIFKTESGQGHDVVVVHGWGCDQRHMQPVVDQLAKRYRVTNLDLPGRGKSEWQPNIQTIHDIADCILPSLPAHKAIYVGWSFGGLVAISIAARYPERVQQIVGITTTPKFIATSDWPGVPAPGFQASFGDIETQGFNKFFHALYEAEFNGFAPKPPAYHQLLKLLDETPIQNFDILLTGVRICDATDLRQEFKLLQCPVDLILGLNDEAVPVATHQQIQTLRPNTNIHQINNAGHMPFWTHPDEFSKILNSIL